MKYFKLLLFCGILFRGVHTTFSQNTLYMNPIKYTDRNLNSYNDNCSDPSKLHYLVNNVEISRSTVYYCCGFHAFSIDYGLMKPGDVFKVTQDCSPIIYSQVVKDDYVYIEVPNGNSYTGNGILPTDEYAPYAKLTTPVSIGKCENININAHGLSEYFVAFYPQSTNLTVGTFLVNNAPIASGATTISPAGHTISSQGTPNVTSVVNANGSITSNGSFKLTSNTALSGNTPITMEYQHNGVNVGGDFAFGFGAMYFGGISNTGFRVIKSSTAGVSTETTFTGSYSNAAFKITYDGTYYRAYLNGVKIDELRRFVKYAASSGTISQTGPLNYGTGVTWTPSSAGTQWISTEVDGILYTRQQFTVADDMTLTAATTNVACFGGNTGSIATSITGGKSPYTYSINGGVFSATSTFTNLVAGPYTVQAKDASGCTTSRTFSVSENPVLSLTASKTDITCFGSNNGSVTLSASGGSGSYTYSADGTNYVSTATFSNLSEGTKTFYVKDGGACVKSVSVTLTHQSKLVASINNQTNVACFGGNTGAVKIGTNGSNPNGTLQYSIGGAFQTDSSFTSLSNGTYTITVKDNTCQTTLQLDITQPTDLVISPNIDKQISCNGLTDGQITVVATGGTGTYQFSIDNITFGTSAVFNNLAANNYKFWVKDANSCLKSSGIYTIIEPTALALSVASKVDVICNGGNTGSITLIASGGTTTPSNVYTYSIDNGTTYQTSNSFTNLSAGTYTLKVRDANGCTKTTTTSILEQTAIAITSNITKTITCYGASDGEVTLSATGGAGSYQYSKDNSNFYTNPVFGGLNTGDYTFYVKDANECPKTIVVTVGQPSLLVPSIVTQTNVLCNGGADGAVDLGASGGTSPYQYSKDGTNFQGTIGFTGFAVGAVTFTVKDSKGCSKTINTTITEPSVLVATATASQQVSCFGGSNGTIQVSGTGGTSPYQYSNNGTTYQSSNAYSGLVQGNYSYWVKDANGCVKTTTNTTITQPTDIVSSVSTKNDVKCFGGNDGSLTISASGGTGSFLYSKDGVNFQTLNNFLNLTAQTYTISVKDQNACIKTINSQVLEPTAFQVNSVSNQNLTCYGNNTGRIEVLGTGGTSTYQYSVDNTTFQGSNVFTGLAAGTYTVYAKDAHNCLFNLNNNVISQPSDIIVSLLEKVDVDCDYYQKGSFKVGASGGVGSFTYNLSGQDLKFNPIAGQSNTTGVFPDLFAGNYLINAQDATGCIKPFPVTIVPKNSHITFNVSKTLPTNCNNADGSITINSVGGGNNPYQYRLSTQSTFSNNNTFAGLGNGKYIITVADGLCAYNQAVDLSLPNSLNATYTISPISCAVPNGDLNITNITGGNGNYSLSIDGTNFSNNTTFNNLSPKVYAITIKDSPQSCQTVISLELKEQNRADLTLNSKTDILCNGANTGVVSMIGNNNLGPFMYALNQKTSFGSNGTFTGLVAANYKVYAKSNIGCIDSLKVTLTQPTAVTGSLTKSDNNCFGDRSAYINAAASGGVSPYTYSIDGINYGASASFTQLLAGDYVIKIKDTNGCILPKNITLVQPTLLVPSSSVGQNVSCFAGTDGNVIVSASGGTIPYQFSHDSLSYTTNNTFGSLKADAYTYFVKDAKGCVKQTAAITVTQPTLLVPKVSSISNVKCFGGSDGIINLTAKGGVEPYQYSSELNNFGDSPHLTGFVAGSYTLYVKDAHGCVKQVNQDLSQPLIIKVSVSVSKNVSCFEGNDGELIASSEGGVKPYLYAIDSVNFSDNPNFKGLQAKRFVISVKDSNNCIQKANSIGISEPPLLVPSVVSQTDVSCFGGNDGKVNTNASGGTSPYLYTLNEIAFDTIRAFKDLKKQVYTLSVKDAKGCIKTLPININQPDELVIKAIYQDTIPCFKDVKGVALIKAFGGTAKYVYSKNGTDFLTDSTFNSLAAGDYTFYVKDAKQCQKKTELKVTEPALLELTLVKATNPLCLGDANGKIEVLAKGGNSGYNYVLDNSIKNNEGLFSNLTQDKYALLVIDRKNCKQTIPPVELIWPKALSFTPTIEEVKCVGDKNGKITLNVSGGTLPYTVKTPITTNDFTDDFSFYNLPAGTYKYYITDGNGCQLSVPIKLAEPQSLNPIVFDAPKEVCIGQIVSLNTNNPNRKIQWYKNGKADGDSVTRSISEPAEYFVSVKNLTGCEVTGKYTLVNNKNALKVDFILPTQAFIGDTIVALDITKPLPNKTVWIIPSDAQIENRTLDKCVFIPTSEGEKKVGLYAYSGECESYLFRNIKIFDPKDVAQTDTSYKYNLNPISTITVFPNPNQGQFSLTIRLKTPVDLHIKIVRVVTGELIYNDILKPQTTELNANHNYPFNLSLKTGVYSLILETGIQKLSKQIVITNY